MHPGNDVLDSLRAVRRGPALAERSDFIDAGEVGGLRLTVVTGGADNPPTPQVGGSVCEQAMGRIPDFIANAAGLIRVSMYCHVLPEPAGLRVLQEMLRRSRRLVPDGARPRAIPPAQAAPDPVPGRMTGATGLGWVTPLFAFPGRV